MAVKPTAKKKAAGKAAPARRTAAQKAVPSAAATPSRVRQPTAKPSIGKPRQRPSKAVDHGSRNEGQQGEAQHAMLSPEEAVAHIQALLKAKQQRVRQGPTWPGAEAATHPDSDAAEAHLPSHANASVDSAPNHGNLAHARGEQLKKS